MPRLGLALLTAPALAAVSPLVAQAPRSFSIEDIDFTRDCAPNAAFERLLTVLLPRSASETADAPPAFDEPLFNAVSGHAVHVLHFHQSQPWHGLHLAEVRLLFGIESGSPNHSLVFADPPERVRAVWNARGWDLPPADETRVIDDEVILTAVGIEADGALAAVTCFSD